MAEYTIKNFYQGGYSTLDPNKSYGINFIGYHSGAGEKHGSFGLTTDVRTANILQDISSKIASGTKHMEISAIQPEVFESIPQQHLTEVRRLGKLTGVTTSVHGVMVEPSGITREGYSESGRQASERQMFSAVMRAHEVDPKGNVVVTFHSSAALPGTIIPKGRDKEKPDEVFVVNAETGAIAGKVPIKPRHFPGEEVTLTKEIEKINEDSWRRELSNLGFSLQRGMGFAYKPEIAFALKAKEEGKELPESYKHAILEFNIGKTAMDDAYRELQRLYDQAKEHGSDDDKKKLTKLGEEIKSQVDELKKAQGNGEDILITTDMKKKILEKGVGVLNEIKTIPGLIVPLEKFAQVKTEKTFGELAFQSWEKFKDNSPIISIENPPVGGAFSTAEELKKIIEGSRKQFVEIAKKEGYDEAEAKEQAEKLIGATWDVGHINMLRKHGYESKDIVEQAKIIKPFVKHMHLSDNFGLDHTELPMGMGNVPIKEIMEKLGKEGFEAKKVIEAGNWWQHFKTPPLTQTLEAFGAPFYTSAGSPYWNQSIGLLQGYFGGYGQMLPQMNYEMFGAGFANLPAELGGQKPNAQGSRMSGRGME